MMKEYFQHINVEYSHRYSFYELDSQEGKYSMQWKNVH
jgi:hypothetical protein